MEVPSLVKEGSPEKRNGEKLNEEDKAPHVGGGGAAVARTTAFAAFS